MRFTLFFTFHFNPFHDFFEAWVHESFIKIMKADGEECFTSKTVAKGTTEPTTSNPYKVLIELPRTRMELRTLRPKKTKRN